MDKKIEKAAETIISMCTDYLMDGLEDEVFKKNIILFSRVLNENKDEQNKYSDLINAGNSAQIQQMEKYENIKSGYENIDLFLASRKIINKCPALLKISVLDYNENNLKRMIRECADISNYAHMMILKCNKELER